MTRELSNFLSGSFVAEEDPEPSDRITEEIKVRTAEDRAPITDPCTSRLPLLGQARNSSSYSHPAANGQDRDASGTCSREEAKSWASLQKARGSMRNLVRLD